MVSVQAYGSMEEGARRRETRRVVRPAAYLALALTALVALACVAALGGGGSAGGGPVEAAEINTYKGWLGKLSGDPEYESGGGQESHLANAALPFSSKIGSLQGKDFAKDVVRAPPSTHLPAAPGPRLLVSTRGQVGALRVAAAASGMKGRVGTARVNRRGAARKGAGPDSRPPFAPCAVRAYPAG